MLGKPPKPIPCRVAATVPPNPDTYVRARGALTASSLCHYCVSNGLKWITPEQNLLRNARFSRMRRVRTQIAMHMIFATRGYAGMKLRRHEQIQPKAFDPTPICCRQTPLRVAICRTEPKAGDTDGPFEARNWAGQHRPDDQLLTTATGPLTAHS